MSTTADNPSRIVRFQMLMTQAESDAIDDWRFANRINSKAEAIRLLVQKALKQEKTEGAGNGKD